jgi:hypothetical protein
MIDKEWNRSSAFDPETMGRFNSMMAENVEAIWLAISKKQVEDAAAVAAIAALRNTLSPAEWAAVEQIFREHLSAATQESLIFLKSLQK